MNNIQTIGILAMAAKPYHAGHEYLIKLAAADCDTVKVFLSTADRGNISWKKMKIIWDNFIKNSLPPNVEIIECHNSPIAEIYQFIDKHQHEDLNFKIFSDIDDCAKSWSDKNFQKYFPNLFENDKICAIPISRNNTIDINGAKMRQALQTGDASLFREFLPLILQKNFGFVWKTLSAH